MPVDGGAAGDLRCQRLEPRQRQPVIGAETAIRGALGRGGELVTSAPSMLTSLALSAPSGLRRSVAAISVLAPSSRSSIAVPLRGWLSVPRSTATACQSLGVKIAGERQRPVATRAGQRRDVRQRQHRFAGDAAGIAAGLGDEAGAAIGHGEFVQVDPLQRAVEPPGEAPIEALADPARQACPRERHAGGVAARRCRSGSPRRAHRRPRADPPSCAAATPVLPVQRELLAASVNRATGARSPAAERQRCAGPAAARHAQERREIAEIGERDLAVAAERFGGAIERAARAELGVGRGKAELVQPIMLPRKLHHSRKSRLLPQQLAERRRQHAGKLRAAFRR